MTPRRRQTLLVLGASGDLAQRLLLPGLGSLLTKTGDESLSLIGSATGDYDDARWREQVAASFKAGGATGDAADAVAEGARYLRADATAADDLRRLLDACAGEVVLYFAVAPDIARRACQALLELDLPDGLRLVFEKPFGTDEKSARELNALATRLVPEDHVFRVDHFLGMSTVLNIVGVRFANRMLEPMLNGGHVETVDIVFDETLGLEGRAGYYDGAGALVDMIQSHLLQVMSIVAMEPPSSLDATDFRDARAQVLRATRLWDDDPASSTFRARYTAGEVQGRTMPAYVDEEGIPSDSTTETLAEVVLAVDTWRWAGVPFRLRSGKAIGNPRQEVVITFRRSPHVPSGLTGHDRPDRLRIGIAPDAGRLALDLNVNGPGDPNELDPVTLEAALAAGELAEYGEVLRGVLDGDPTLSVRGDMAVECWRVVDHALEAWREDRAPLQEYPAGSAGPDGWPLPGELTQAST